MVATLGEQAAGAAGALRSPPVALVAVVVAVVAPT